MIGTWPGDRPEGLQDALAGALSVGIGDLDLDSARRGFLAEGYDFPTWLAAFVARYSELKVVWRATRGGVNELDTSVVAALDATHGNVRLFGQRLGKRVLPVGMVFETEEQLLLAANGEIWIGGDAGLQRVGPDFEVSVKSLINNDWDKTFVYRGYSTPGTW
ncbi:SUKH-3 immunity protein [Asanoa hainanensis]|uniref:SUKH-3 immunity protein n=1 Tax=Asanoa hainanensis TaxID=560556 RepID=A0A239PC58_9ACTN|nr:SUKH-3 domain-containing protein [Asanoa hainanensis]SNT64611.1 SUKH-3 immunity protein [Asanoa hainanensis]